MTPSEMEEQIKNLNQWASEVAQYLPLLATKEDLKNFATKEDLTATKEELTAGVEDAKRYTENLMLVTRREIRQVPAARGVCLLSARHGCRLLTRSASATT
jgi:hypothetical protein